MTQAIDQVVADGLEIWIDVFFFSLAALQRAKLRKCFNNLVNKQEAIMLVSGQS